MASSQAVRQDRSEPSGGSGHSRTHSRVSGKKFSKRELEEIQQAFMRPDPDIDRRIVQGMLSDPDALIKDLAREGITKNLVLRRAADCGISEAVLRQIKRVAADLAGGETNPHAVSSGPPCAPVRVYHVSAYSSPPAAATACAIDAARPTPVWQPLNLFGLKLDLSQCRSQR